MDRRHLDSLDVNSFCPLLVMTDLIPGSRSGGFRNSPSHRASDQLNELSERISGYCASLAAEALFDGARDVGEDETWRGGHRTVTVSDYQPSTSVL